MAKKRQQRKRTDKSKYKSRFCPQETYITAAQFIIEIVCSNKARADKKELPYLFWDLPEWSKIWRAQLRGVHKLLKTYREDAIIRVLQDPKNSRVYSVYAPWLPPLFKKEHDRLMNIDKELEAQKAELTKHNVNISVGNKVRNTRISGRLGSLSEIDDE